jgi:hypothetical protein
VQSWHNYEAAQLDFESLDFKIMPGSRHLVGFIRDLQKRDKWLAEKTSFWTPPAIGELAATARLYPQSAQTVLQCSLQQEWQYVQHVMGDIPGAFSEVEKVIQDMVQLQVSHVYMELSHLEKIEGFRLQKSINSKIALGSNMALIVFHVTMKGNFDVIPYTALLFGGLSHGVVV